MQKNVGKIDRIIRFGVGVVGLVLGFLMSPWFFILALGGFFTAATGFCGLYTIFGIKTCSIEKQENTSVDV